MEGVGVLIVSARALGIPHIKIKQLSIYNDLLLLVPFLILWRGWSKRGGEGSEKISNFRGGGFEKF